MKSDALVLWSCWLVTLFLVSSCATRHETLPPGPQEITALPQIGSRHAGLTQEKNRPPILAGLIKKSEKKIAFRQYDEAFATLESALGIDNQDPYIWHLMAKIRLKQDDPDQAEDLARKSNTLASRTPSLKSKNWNIIAEALRRQGRVQEAEQAKKKADE